MEIREVHNENDVLLNEHAKNVSPHLLYRRRDDFWNSRKIGNFVKIGANANHDVVSLVVGGVLSIRFYAKNSAFFWNLLCDRDPKASIRERRSCV